MQIHVDRGGQRFGPYEVEEVNAYLASGSLLDTDLGWTDGMTDWVPLSQLPGVATSAGAPPAHSNSAGQSAGKKKLFIGIGASVGVCVIGVAVWLLMGKDEATKPGEDKPAAGAPADEQKAGQSLAEFIKDKRIYFALEDEDLGEFFVFRQFNTDGKLLAGFVHNGQYKFQLPGNVSPSYRYEVQGLVIKVTETIQGFEAKETTINCPNAIIKVGDVLAIQRRDGVVDNMPVAKIKSGPF